jgi:pimeloyl-ACP methyl ester carboxylesterase
MEFLSACAWSPQSTATCSDVEFHRIGEAGHWTLFEQPEALSQIMIDWLTRRFGG